MKANSIINAAPICPRCEFRHRSPGSPRRAGPGLWHCGECGARWRNVGEIAVAADAGNPVGDVLAMLRPGGRIGTAGAARGSVFPTLRAIAAGLAVVAVAVLGWQAAAIARSGAVHDASATAPAAEPAFALSELKAQKLLRGGRMAVRVEGQITNRTAVRQAVAPLDISIVRGQATDAWRHQPTLRYLEPGQTIRFSTASDIGGTPERIEIRFAGLTLKTGI